MPRVIKSIIAVSFCLSLLWAFLLPAWQFPDEQAHFAQVQDYAELKTIPKENDVSFEIFESTRLLGTLRDDQGRNKYTPVPGYQLPLSQTKWGFEEAYLKTLPLHTRTNYVKLEAPRYPPLYYMAAALGYNSVAGRDLFSRLLATRFISVIIFTLTVVAAYYISRELFHESILQIAATGVIAFHPMFMFVGSGVTNDGLMNLIGTALIACTLPLFHRAVNWKDLLILGLLMIAGIFTKQLLFLFFPLIILVVLYSTIKYSHARYVIIAIPFISILSIIGYSLAVHFNQGFWLPYWPSVQTNLVTFFQTYATLLIKLYRETFAWYWGVFKWLGLVLPMNVLRIIKIGVAVSILGIISSLIRERKYVSFERFQLWIFIGVLNLVYFFALTIWDTSLTINNGFSHGIQGRYFFPLLSTQMAFLVYGGWLAIGHYLKKWYALILTFSFLFFNLSALWYVLGAYYHRSSLSLLLLEISQYKPDFAKWPTLSLYLLLAGISVVIMILSLGKYVTKKDVARS